MCYLTFGEYEKRVQQLNLEYWNKSYLKRWEYMKEVLDELKKIKPKSSLEIGTVGIPLLSISDGMDRASEYIHTNGKSFICDARETPWDIPDKTYDVFIALQVLEHLGPNQIQVFNEIKRISKYAIITLPYKWDNVEKDNCHYMIDENKINEWVSNEVPYKIDIKERRIMLCYKF